MTRKGTSPNERQSAAGESPCWPRCFCCPRRRSADGPALDPDLPYQAQRSNPVSYDVDFSVIITAPSHTKKLCLWLPLPPSDAGQEVTEGSLTTFPMQVKPKVGREARYGNRFAYFEFAHPQGAQIIRHRFKVKVWELRWGVDRERVARVVRWPDGFDRYLRAEGSSALNDAGRRLLRDVVPRSHGEADDLAAVMGWVNDRLRP